MITLTWICLSDDDLHLILSALRDHQWIREADKGFVDDEPLTVSLIDAELDHIDQLCEAINTEGVPVAF